LPEVDDDHSYVSDSSSQAGISLALNGRNRRAAIQKSIIPLERTGRYGRRKSVGDSGSARRSIAKVYKKRSVSIKTVIKQRSELWRLQESKVKAALGAFKPEKLQHAARQDKGPNGRKLKFLEVKRQTNGETLTDSTLSRMRNDGCGIISSEEWAKICPQGAHSCSFCRELCIKFVKSGSRSEGQSQLFQYDRIIAAEDSRCTVFSWLRQLLSAEGRIDDDGERYFTLSLVPDHVFLESNNFDQFSFESHGFLGAYLQDGR
jgi:hypothetical protein